MAGLQREDWFEREEFIGQISDIRVQNLQVEREVVQKRTFTRWMNLHLEKCNPPIQVQDLFCDIQDGHVLMALLEELSGCKLLHGFKKSSHRIFRLNNIAKVLSFLEERNVKLVSIDAADVTDGNPSIILGLIWNIILFFQIKELTGNIRSQFPSSSSLSSIPTSSDSSFCLSNEQQSISSAMREHSKAIKKLLQWVQKRTRKFGVAVQDFGKSWVSGLALLAVIKSIDSSLVDMRKALLRTARENLEEAFRIAHYSLGIPQLLEPEDITTNAPDEQSIMTYVSQFLEHFPDIDEEVPCQPIERSASTCRLNLRDSYIDHIRNDGHSSIVKERSYMFQRDRAKPPPKILISSVSEDRGKKSFLFRAGAARPWSSEDILGDSSHLDSVSRNGAEELKEATSDISINSPVSSPQLCCTPSPTSTSVSESVNSESVIGDSAISSPESWVETHFAVMPEKFCETQSDSFLCDSGTAWDVYRAIPVEVTTPDEGFVPSMEDRAPDGQPITDPYIDEGIYSLSSLESTQEMIEHNPAKEKAPVVTVYNVVKHDLGGALDQSGAEITGEEVDCKQIEPILIQEGDLASGPCDAEAVVNTGVPESQKPEQFQYMSNTELTHLDHSEDVIEQTRVAEGTCEEYLKDSLGCSRNVQDIEGQINGLTESQIERKNSEDVVETKCQETHSPFETTNEIGEEIEVLKERVGDVGETQIKEYIDPQESFGSEIYNVLTTTHPEGRAETSKISLTSVSSKSEMIEVEGICDPQRQGHHAGLVHQVGSDKDVSSPQNLNKLCDDSHDNNGKEVSSCLTREDLKITTWQQREDRGCDETISRSSMDNMEVNEAKPEHESIQHDSLAGNTEKALMDLVSFKNQDCQLANPEQEVKLTEQPCGLSDKPDDSVSVQHIILDPANSKHSSMADVPCCDEGSVSRDEDLFYSHVDQFCPKDDLAGNCIEPMDLFYPDKEEPIFLEPPDADTQSWPSVLSVSALQPAPASDSLPDDPPLFMLDEDIGIRLGQQNDQEDKSQEHDFFSGEMTGGLWDGGDVPADGSDLTDERNSSGAATNSTESLRTDTELSCRHFEQQIPPVLHHRKGRRSTESMDNRSESTVPTDTSDSGSWRSDDWELCVLLVLWLLLYCWWLLPQMDLKTMPSLLLNLHR
ncbi:uncharacterized protein clmna [Antennarius striatus]|uniref:uncharacterized protein clmna n=1 Tax=Antennarius striatus TaxID=241820 RepID=UPI0035AFAF8C